MSETRESELRELIAKATRASTWSIEPHGGTTALYSGREDIIGEAFGHPMRGHGLRLMNLDDGDHNFAANGALIVAAVNALPGLLDEIDALRARVEELKAEIADGKQENGYIIGWNSGWDEAFARLKFPTMLRKMWSGGEVQSWLDDRKREQTGPIPGSLTDRLFSAVARAEAAERRLLPPALTEAQREILAQAMCDANTGGGFWPHFEEQSRNPWFGITDRFRAILAGIEKEGE
jgi:hypothetical protein